ncbi:MAG: hypothetical protein DI616_05925 [Paracoccus denitrificans]|uniref:Uncharacterized protein n=1 Tax=Paracoccus denitrificans TaxID=266 RepID=A0A533IBE2_PARDE|nr:MAG: hypothetical protein DI616_05925 [Paracoccus denitrificans]
MTELARLGGFAAVFLLAAPPVLAGAAWDAFTTHCLHPLEAGRLEQPTDLAAAAHYKNDGDTYSRYALEDGRIELSVSDGRAGRPKWCRLRTTSSGPDDTAKDFLGWAERQGPGAGYEGIPSSTKQIVMRGRAGTPVAGIEVTMTTTLAQDFILLEAARHDATPAKDER